MSYWCDDQSLNLEQRRLDANQQRAQEAEHIKAKAENREPASWAKKENT